MTPALHTNIREHLALLSPSDRQELMALLVEKYPLELRLAIGRYREPSAPQQLRWWLVASSGDILDVDAHPNAVYQADHLLDDGIPDGATPCCLTCGSYGVERLFCSLLCEARFLADLVAEDITENH